MQLYGMVSWTNGSSTLCWGIKRMTYVTLSTFMNENSLVHVLRLTVYTIYSKTWLIQNARNQFFFNYEETIIKILFKN
jgi:hypothetical protein